MNHPELREREALKGLRLAALMADALVRRNVPRADLHGRCATRRPLPEARRRRWSDDGEFGEVAWRTLDELGTAATTW
jgi:hypothetical protein